MIKFPYARNNIFYKKQRTITLFTFKFCAPNLANWCIFPTQSHQSNISSCDQGWLHRDHDMKYTMQYFRTGSTVGKTRDLPPYLNMIKPISGMFFLIFYSAVVFITRL